MATVFRHKINQDLYVRSIFRGAKITGSLVQCKPLSGGQWITETPSGMFSEKNFEIAYVN